MGWVRFVIGLLLSVGIAFLAFHLHDLVLHGNDPGSRSHWKGGPAFTRVVFELFGVIFLFGLTAMTAGLYQVRHGRPHPIINVLLFLGGAAMAYMGSTVSNLPPTP